MGIEWTGLSRQLHSAPVPRTDAYVEAVRSAAVMSAFSVKKAWQWTPGWLVRLIITNLLIAVVPAAQVVAVRWLVASSSEGYQAWVPPLVILVVIIGLGLVLGENLQIVGQRIRNRLRSRYQAQLLDSVAALTPQQLASSEVSATIQACRSSLFDIGRLINSTMAAAAAVVTAATLCISVSLISPVAGILVVAALVPNLLVFAWEARLQSEAFIPFGRQERLANYQTEQLVTQRSATELATLGTGHKVARLADASQRQADRIMDRILISLSRADSLGGVATAVILGLALVAILHAGAGGAGVAAGITGVVAGMAATRSAGFSYGDLMTIAPEVAAYRAFIHDAPPRPAQAIIPHVDEVRADHVTVTYPGMTTPALRDFTFEARLGEIVALVGVNGAGKTTAVSALMGIVDSDGGTVTIDGADASAMTPHQRLSYFGLLSQEFGRYEFKVRDAVDLGTPERDLADDELWQALRSSHSDQIVGRLPDTIDSQLGPQFDGAGLSGGQWQRLALARIYARNAAIWILDEPTSAIDAEAEQQIFAELQRTKHDRITIVVSHRAWSLKGMDRIYVLDDGRIVQQGSYQELIAANGRFSQIFKEQFETDTTTAR